MSGQHDNTGLFQGRDLACVRGERPVFAGLDFTLEPGRALLLLGPNGSGKSSLLRVMAGLLRPASGALLWDGAPVSEDPEAFAARIHYVGHHDPIKPVLTVAENLTLWSRLRGTDAVAANVARALDALNIPHLADVPGRFLSAGQKRRANLARLVAVKAPLWLLDEPTTALDVDSVRAFEQVIADHLAAGGMVAASTHTALAVPGADAFQLAEFGFESVEVA